MEGEAKAGTPQRTSKRRRRLWRALVVLGLITLLLVLDQLGVRELSGRDFPPRDPLSSSLRAHVEQLASPSWGGRVPGTEGNAAAARYLAEALEAAGVKPFPSLGGYLQPLAEPASPLGHNVLGWIPPHPGDGPASVVVLGAHFDHIGKTSEGLLLGADDNAAAVAVLLGALPSILAVHPRPYGVAIAFFNTEEAPYFGTVRQGSRRFVAALPNEIGEVRAIRLAVVLDLVGGVVWRRTASTLFACGAEKTSGLGELVDGVREEGLDVRRLGIHLVENIPGYAPQPFSDYDIFRKMRVPFLFLSSGRTPRYHRPSDLPDTLHYDRMAQTSRWIARLVAAAGPPGEARVFEPKGEDYAADLATLRFTIDAAAKPWSSVPGTSPMTAIRLLGDRARLEAMAEPGHVWTAADALSLERAGFRLQCLLYRFPVCFTL
ncbi:M28 family metallopeptidase [Polyangium aurulentum]|uniref:M28 family metallopeptidase n=1 Tax=Polyangium aurulentum TaxID=2567896 RepID=UPI00146B66D4|nr:M28 family peptidase [Polyangium aurulentum]UQA58047.1 M28 family peptidase [Polyangium aurulentum]